MPPETTYNEPIKTIKLIYSWAVCQTRVGALRPRKYTRLRPRRVRMRPWDNACPTRTKKTTVPTQSWPGGRQTEASSKDLFNEISTHDARLRCYMKVGQTQLALLHQVLRWHRGWQFGPGNFRRQHLRSWQPPGFGWRQTWIDRYPSLTDPPSESKPGSRLRERKIARGNDSPSAQSAHVHVMLHSAVSVRPRLRSRTCF